MIDLKERLAKRRESENGFFILIMAMLIILTILGMSFGINGMSMRLNASEAQHSYAQRALQVGIQSQNPAGGLTEQSARDAINDYLQRRNSAGGLAGNMTAYCARNYPIIEITFQDQRRTGRTATAGSPRVTFSPASGIQVTGAGYFNTRPWTIMQMQVTEAGQMQAFNSPFNRRGRCRETRVNASVTVTGNFGHENFR